MSDTTQRTNAYPKPRSRNSRKRRRDWRLKCSLYPTTVKQAIKGMAALPAKSADHRW